MTATRHAGIPFGLPAKPLHAGHPDHYDDDGYIVSETSMRPFIAAFFAAIALLTAGAAAHHGWGSYDVEKKFTLESTVKHIEWSNPHVHLMADHDGASWTLILAPVSRMERRGMSASMLAVGASFAAEGYPSTKVEHEMRAERITVGGKTFELR
jgi:hypothetical protein